MFRRNGGGPHSGSVGLVFRLRRVGGPPGTPLLQLRLGGPPRVNTPLHQLEPGGPPGADGLDGSVEGVGGRGAGKMVGGVRWVEAYESERTFARSLSLMRLLADIRSSRETLQSTARTLDS